MNFAPIKNQIIVFTQANYPHLQCLRLANYTHGNEELNCWCRFQLAFCKWKRGPELGFVALSLTKLVMYFVDRLELQRQGREFPQLTLPSLMYYKDLELCHH